MKLQLGQVVSAVAGINEIIKKELPTKAAYRMMRNAKALESEVKTFDAAKMALFEKYGTKEADKIVVAPEQAEAFSKAFDELVSEEVDVAIMTVPISMIEGASFTTADMFSLEFMIEDDKGV